MSRIRSFGLSIWILLVSVFISGQLLSPFFTSIHTPEDFSIEKGIHFNQTDHSSDFFIQSNRSELSISIHVIQNPFFKWKSILPDDSPDSLTPISFYSEFIQDSWRCASVAFIIFPHHEFT
jgi:hypothetical protein